MIWPFNREPSEVTCPKCEMRVISSCDRENRFGGCPVPDAYADRRAQPAAIPAAAQEQAAPSDELVALFREAVAWGCVYGEVIPAHQWDSIRDEMAEKFSARHGAQPALTEQDRQDIETGRKWRENSSLEEWFPLTAEELVSTQRMFQAAVSDLAAISERLGMDPDDAGADAFIAAIDDLAQPAASAEPVAWINEDDLPDNYPYDEMFGFSQILDGVRMFPVFWPGTVITPEYLDGHKDGLEWAAQMAEANDPRTGDWLYDDPHELARALRKGPEMPAGQASGQAQDAEDAARYRWLRDRNDWYAEPRLDAEDGTMWRLTFYTPAQIIDPTDDDNLDVALIAAMLADAANPRDAARQESKGGEGNG
ncbi:FIG00639676: hypothetical protein [plant metagenome]|uniref:Uncharacterized protein n=1 Tax=plant metagenome TaxID=1297885 RepID=A0A484Q279_9ZZZZ